jgi:hypothetical protein
VLDLYAAAGAKTAFDSGALGHPIALAEERIG